MSSHNYKGFSLKVLGKKIEALKHFEIAEKLNKIPVSAEQWFNKALSMYGLEHYEKAIFFYDKVIEMIPDDPIAYNR